MNDSTNKSITVIGNGALGSTLLQFFKENGYFIRSTWNSKGGRVYIESHPQVQSQDRTFPKKNEEVGDLVFITIPDDLVGSIARNLSEQSITWDQKTVIHCSGNLTSDELDSLEEKGAETVSMHPIQSFKTGDGSERFKEITISLQGSEIAKEELIPIIRKMGAKHLNLSMKQKRYLHIAAVMASNYMVALMYSVENLLKDVDLGDAFESLKPLVHQTNSNIFEKGPANALTGPISRGDIDSIKKHLKELKGREQEDLYKILGREAAKIAENSVTQNNNLDTIKNMFE